MTRTDFIRHYNQARELGLELVHSGGYCVRRADAPASAAWTVLDTQEQLVGYLAGYMHAKAGR